MKKVSIIRIPEKKNGQATGKVACWAYRFERKDHKPNGSRNIAYRQGFKSKKEAEEAGYKAFNIEYGIIPDPTQSKEASSLQCSLSAM